MARIECPHSGRHRGRVLVLQAAVPFSISSRLAEEIEDVRAEHDPRFSLCRIKLLGWILVKAVHRPVPSVFGRNIVSLSKFISTGTSREVGSEARHEAASARRHRRVVRWLLVGVAGLLLVAVELHTSVIQAAVFSTWAASMSAVVEPGPSDRTAFPEHGPHDGRLGYTQIPAWTRSLDAHGFSVSAQARVSDAFQRAVAWGLYPSYDRKAQAGLSIAGRDGDDLYRAAYPRYVYASPDSVPTLITETLLFIENRELLGDHVATKNPAIEWDRFAQAAMQRILSGGEGPGGSTLATQLAKVRHSPDGRTSSVGEKLRQIASASLAAYAGGMRTTQMRHVIVQDYLNALPLSASPGHGEVNGLGDGLWVWYGAEPDQVNRLLFNEARPSTLHGSSDQVDRERGTAYRQVLSLLLSTRSPSRFLRSSVGRGDLAALTDRYLILLHDAGVIDDRLLAAAREAAPEIRQAPAPSATPPFVARKAASAIRGDLLRLLDAESLPAMDRYDLTAHTTFDGSVQRATTDFLEQLRDPAFIRQQRLVGDRLLGGGDPSRVTYSVVLYEVTPGANHLRVQADNFLGPFDVNRQSKLELGSTAKLRTLVTYLELIEEVFRAHQGQSADSLRRVSIDPQDALTRWTVQQMIQSPDASLAEMLEAAMDRTYSSSPGERFFTGGGMHTFSNFDPSTAGPMTVRSAMRYSVNLVFIRMMRDIVNYHIARLPGQPAFALVDTSDTRRETYLRRFADQEGRTFLRRYYQSYGDEQTPGTSILEQFGLRHRMSARRLAWAYRSIAPEAHSEAFGRFLRTHAMDGQALSDARVETLYRESRTHALSWQDRGYLAGVHPLELWLVQYFHRRPDASLAEAIDASSDVRQDVYAWLYTRRARAQNQRIRIVLEQEAFIDIHRRWARVGYPFARLVPTYATAIGSSADRPAALAELTGILLRDGYRYPSVRIESLHAGEGTPYETRWTRTAVAPVQVLSAELSAVVRASMIDVVDRGTAARARGAMLAADGTALAIGGKTGTGDNRLQIMTVTGRRESRAMSRTSTFVFFVGDRFYGTVVAYVPGEMSGSFRFTSSLVTSVLQLLGPTLQPLVDAPLPEPPRVQTAGSV